MRCVVFKMRDKNAPEMKARYMPRCAFGGTTFLAKSDFRNIKNAKKYLKYA